MTDVTRILNAIEEGDSQAADELLPLVYEELRLLATRKMSNEAPGQTLEATALVHEAYIRLVGTDAHNWNSRGHFYAAAAEAMRRILIDNARRKKSLRRGGGHRRVELDAALLQGGRSDEMDDLIALDEALERLAENDPVKADLVKLRYFGGLTSEQAARVLGVSPASAERYWDYARSWLRVEIAKEGKTG
ncbi:MAG: sigma-70 family RNA polymerase sigma factor [Planctomycetota bacterium]|jgi:RNA polymerase sigma factor (TIGR02999 family)